MTDEWTPSGAKRQTSQPIRQRNRRSNLTSHPDARVANIGAFCEAAPPNMDPGEVAASAIILGLAFGAAHPDEAETVLRLVLSVTRDPSYSVDAAYDMAVQLADSMVHGEEAAM